MREHFILRRIFLKPHHPPMGNTRHYRNGRELPAPFALEIARHAGDPGVYLFYQYAADNEMTDTYHESLENAVSQAEREFCVGEDEWLVVSPEKTS